MRIDLVGKGIATALQILNTESLYLLFLLPLAVIQHRNVPDERAKQAYHKELEQEDVAHISSLNAQQRQAV